MAGLKKCVPMTNAGREVTEAISSISSVEVLLARIAPGLQDAIEFFEDFFFEGHAFEDGFDDEIGFAEIVVGERGSDAFEALGGILRSEAAAFYGIRVIGLDGGEAAIERGLVRVF